MEEMDSTFDSSKLLPNDLLIKHAGNHFYKIGLSPFPYGSTKRIIFYSKPIITNIIIIVLLYRSVVSLVIPEQNPEFNIIIGNFCYFLNLQYQINAVLIASYIYTFSCNGTQYWNYKHNIKPSYM